MPEASRASSRDDEVAWRELNVVENKPGAAAQWGLRAMVMRIVCYLHRLLGPITKYLTKAIENSRTQGILTVAMPANVQVCIVDTRAGPT